MFKYTVNQVYPIYAWVLPRGYRVDRYLVVQDRIIELGTIAFLKMRELLDPRLQVCIEHVGISWGAVYFEKDTPPLVFSVKVAFPSCSGEVTIDSRQLNFYEFHSIESEADAKQFGIKVAEIIAKAIEEAGSSMTKKLDELRSAITATFTAVNSTQEEQVQPATA